MLPENATIADLNGWTASTLSTTTFCKEITKLYSIYDTCSTKQDCALAINAVFSLTAKNLHFIESYPRFGVAVRRKLAEFQSVGENYSRQLAAEYWWLTEENPVEPRRSDRLIVKRVIEAGR